MKILLVLLLITLSCQCCAVLDMSAFLTEYVYCCSSVYSDEMTWFFKGGARVAENGVLWKTITESRLLILGSAKRLKSTEMNMNTKYRDMILGACKLASSTCIKDVAVYYKKLKVNDICLMDDKFINSLPALFDSLEANLKLDRTKRIILYHILYSTSIVDGKVDILDASFKKLLFGKDADNNALGLSMRALIVGMSNNSKKSAVMWNLLYDYIVSTRKGGPDIFYKDFAFCLPLCHRPIMENRLPVNIHLVNTTSIENLISSSEFVRSKSIDAAPYGFCFQEPFEKHLEKMHKERKIMPHPITGKLLLTNVIPKREYQSVIKMFKIMVCMNLVIPFLALTKEEYDSANEIKNCFVFNHLLAAELSTVTRDILAHFYISGMKSDINTLLMSVLRKNPNVAHQVFFMASGRFLNLPSFDTISLVPAKRKLIVVRKAVPVLVIDQDLTEEELLVLLNNMKPLEGELLDQVRKSFGEDVACAFGSCLEDSAPDSEIVSVVVTASEDAEKSFEEPCLLTSTLQGSNGTEDDAIEKSPSTTELESVHGSESNVATKCTQIIESVDEQVQNTPYIIISFNEPIPAFVVQTVDSQVPETIVYSSQHTTITSDTSVTGSRQPDPEDTVSSSPSDLDFIRSHTNYSSTIIDGDYLVYKNVSNFLSRLNRLFNAYHCDQIYLIYTLIDDFIASGVFEYDQELNLLELSTAYAQNSVIVKAVELLKQHADSLQIELPKIETLF